MQRLVRLWLGLLCYGLFAASTSQAQTISVGNFLNPEAPLTRESFAVAGGDGFTDVELVEPFDPPTTLGGVTVTVEGNPQRLRAVSATRVVFIIDPVGPALRTLELTTKTGSVRRAQIRVVNAWPGVFVQGTGNDSESFYPSGLWTLDGLQFSPITSTPIPVGARSRPTLVIIQGSGWRFAPGIQVRLNGNQCPVVAARSSALFPGQDELVFQIPSFLADGGEMDLIVTVAGRESNYARVTLGAAVN